MRYTTFIQWLRFFRQFTRPIRQVRELTLLAIANRGIILSRQWTRKVLIRLHGCACWSSPLLFAYGIHRFSRDVAQIWHFQYFNISVSLNWVSVHWLTTFKASHRRCKPIFLIASLFFFSNTLIRNLSLWQLLKKQCHSFVFLKMIY